MFRRVHEVVKIDYVLHRCFPPRRPCIVHTSVRMEHPGSHWRDFREILYWEALLKSVEKVQVWLKIG